MTPSAASRPQDLLRDRWNGPLVTSYAQNAEDVRLLRLFASKPEGFYVDVGAGDPVQHSVTKLFYDAGWNGINVEPGPTFDRLAWLRPRDVNLPYAIASSAGEAEMWFTSPDSGLSSLFRPQDDLLPPGVTVTSKAVTTARLDEILHRHASGRHIDFLKIDVEGAERAVLESFDVDAIRPTVLIVEAVAQLDFEPTHSEWEGLILEHGFVRAAFDGINCFYVAAEDSDLVPALEYPISALDRFVLHDATWRRDSSVASADDVGPMDPRVPEERTRKVAAEAREANRELEAIRATLSWRITRPLRAVRELQGRLGSRGSGTETAGRGRPEPAEDTVATEASVDELAPSVRACSARVLQIADLLDGREVSAAAPLAPDVLLDDALERLEHALERSDAPVEATSWLALVAADGQYPSHEMVEAVARLARSSGAAEVTTFLRHRLAHSIGAGLAGTCRLDIVKDSVVIVVETTVDTDLHTGIQRVGRETISRWLDVSPPPALAAFDPQRDAVKLLADTERDRIRAWRHHLPDSGAPIQRRIPATATDNPLVPWRCRVVVADLLFNRQHSRAIATLATSSVVDALSFMCFDLIPVVAPETVDDGITALYCDYLSAVKRAARITTISEQVARDFTSYTTMLRTEGLAGPQVVAHPLPTEAPALSETVLAQGLASLELTGLPLVVVVGVHVPRKNHMSVLEASERLWKDGHSFELLFIGGVDRTSGQVFDRYVRHLRTTGWPVRVLRRATEAELWAAYRAARFTVYPSLIEGYGLPVAESLVCGTPAITSSYGAMAEIASGGGALVIDPRNVDELEEQMRLLLTDDELLERLERRSAQPRLRKLGSLRRGRLELPGRGRPRARPRPRSPSLPIRWSLDGRKPALEVLDRAMEGDERVEHGRLEATLLFQVRPQGALQKATDERRGWRSPSARQALADLPSQLSGCLENRRPRIVLRASGSNCTSFARIRKPVANELARPLGLESLDDLLLSAQADGARLVLSLPDGAQAPSCSIDVGFSPTGAGSVRPPRVGDVHEPIGHEVAVLLRHELEVPGVARRDDRFPARHRFRHRQAEALAAMKRDVAVARRDVRVPLLGGDVAVAQEDVFPTAGEREEPIELVRLPVASVDALQDEDRALSGSERTREGVDDSCGVLALAAPEVEDEQEREAFRQLELGPGAERTRERLRGHGNDVNGNVDLAHDRLADVLARDPELVEKHRRGALG